MASFVVFVAQKAIAEIPLDAIQYPSSIVPPDEVDLSFRSKPFSNQKSGAQRYNLEMMHSHIDRDPIYFDNDHIDPSSFDLLEDIHDMSSNKKWQSPLEKISPLQTKPHSNQVDFISEALPKLINDGPRYDHRIVTNNRPLQSNLQLKARKTGTTITALLACNSTVLILAADTRATDDTTVADSNCEKLHQLARNVWCAGAGTSGDVEAMVRSVKFMFWKKGLLNEVGNLGRNIPYENSDSEEDVTVASLPAILHCLRTQLQKTRGQLGVNLLVGGYDIPSQRAMLAAIHPHGSMDCVTYAALGSGGLAATGVLEQRYPKIGSGHCTLEEGIRLAVDAVRAGVENDLGSGSRVDVCIVAKEKVLYRRAVVKEEVLKWIDDGQDFGAVRETVRNNAGVGVNGFGNIPFAIQSEKVVVSGTLSAGQAKRQWLDAVLGNEEH